MSEQAAEMFSDKPVHLIPAFAWTCPECRFSMNWTLADAMLPDEYRSVDVIPDADMVRDAVWMPPHTVRCLRCGQHFETPSPTPHPGVSRRDKPTP